MKVCRENCSPIFCLFLEDLQKKSNQWKISMDCFDGNVGQSKIILHDMQPEVSVIILRQEIG